MDISEADSFLLANLRKPVAHEEDEDETDIFDSERLAAAKRIEELLATVAAMRRRLGETF